MGHLIKRKRLWISTVVVALVGAPTFMATAASSSNDDTLVYRIAGGVAAQYQDFDMQASTQSINAGLVSYSYDKLMARGPKDKLVPYLGTPMKISANSITFKIRQGAKCADGGDPVTPLVIVNSFKRLLEVPKATSFMSQVFGAGPFHVSANLRQGTFTFTTETPYRNLLAGFAHPATGIVCPAGLTAVAADKDALKKRPYGSGPYTLASYNATVNLTFQLRKDWTWGPMGTTASKDALGRPMPDQIVETNYGSANVANILLTGDADYGIVAGPDLPRIIPDKSFTHKAARNYGSMPLIFNMAPGRITNDLKLRQALSVSFDCKADLKIAFLGQGVCTSGEIFTPGVDCYDKKVVQKYAEPFSIDKARQILVSDGYTYTGGKLVKDGKPLHLVVLMGGAHFGPAGELIASNWSQVGIDVELHNFESATWIRDLYAGAADVIAGSYSFLDPDTLDGMLLYLSGPSVRAGGLDFGNTGGGNGDGSGDPVLEREKGLMFSTIGAESCKHMNNLQEIYLKNRYVLGTVSPSIHYFAKGWDFTPTTWPEPWLIRKLRK